MARDDTSIVIQGYIDRLSTGDESARAALLSCANDRLGRLARKMLNGYPGVARWEQDGDIAQKALIRLDRALREVATPTARDFFRLAASLVRRELIDMHRHYYGPRGIGAHHSSHAELPTPADTTNDPGKLAAWTEFHRAVDALAEADRELFDLLWYQGLTRIDAARLLGVTARTVHNRWLAAKVHLSDSLGGRLPI